MSKNSNIVMFNTPDNFKAGKTARNINIWETLTNDTWIINTIKGCSIELTEIPEQSLIPKPIQFTTEEHIKIKAELQRFLDCGIIEPASMDTKNEFISNIFVRPKKDGRVRIILNLKYFNSNYVKNSHFKMESLRSAINMMRKDCYLASVDLSDAYYSISVREQDRKFLRFFFDGIKYQFTALVMGYSCSPRVWTKLMKPVFAFLRARGHLSVYFIDDSCLMGITFQSCLCNVQSTVQLMDKLGLTVNPQKSVLLPCQRLIFLGFILCSRSMTVRLTVERCQAIISKCKEIKDANRITIREFAKLVGKLNAAEPGVTHAPLYIRPLEKVKEQQLKIHRGNFDRFMTVPNTSVEILQWWMENIHGCYKNIHVGPPDMIIYTDASRDMYGAYDKTHDAHTNGYWSIEDQKEHINVLELKACEIGLLTFCKNRTNIHIRLYTDNMTSCSYINKYGGKYESLDRIARQIWFWCIARHIHVTACHIAGVSNTEADKLSRSRNDDIEWALDKDVFSRLLIHHPNLEIDLFASKLNAKLEKYVSRFPEEKSMASDAFTLTWSENFYYIFPPFSLIARILQKVEVDESEAVLVAPLWPTQAWWPHLIRLIKGPCYLLPNVRNILKLNHKPNKKHHLTRMRLIVFYISGRLCENEDYLKQAKISSSDHGVKALESNTTHILKNGFITVKGRQVPLLAL